MPRTETRPASGAGKGDLDDQLRRQFVPVYQRLETERLQSALNVLELPPQVIALQLGQQDGGRLVRDLYGHLDAAMARERTREAFRSVAPVQALRVSAVGGV